jgi:GT2 family glycosyltransferase
MIDLSIIIVSFNTKELIKNCIESIIKNTNKISYEIIIVDNASNDGSVEYLNDISRDKSPAGQRFAAGNAGRRLVPTIKVIKNNDNLGYAKANNLGIKAAKGKAHLLLNSDTLILAGSIDKAYEHLKKSDILTINLKNEDMTNQQAAGYGPNLFNIFCWAFFIDDLPFLNRVIHPYQISNTSFFNESHPVDWVMGAFFMMKREVVEKIGFLDEKIFMYGEEMEFCHRAKLKKFKIMYYSAPAIIHFGMGSAESSEGAVVGEYKALKYFFSKNHSLLTVKIINVLLKMSIVIRIIIYSVLGSKRTQIYAKAFQNFKK